MQISMEHILYLSKLNINGVELRLVLYLMTILNNNYFVCISQSDIGKEIGLLRQQVNISMQNLVERRLLIKGKPIGRQQTYKINKELLEIERTEKELKN